jgi:toxin secretion/phage lysis holin
MDINIIKELHLANKAWVMLLPCICMAFDIATGLIYAWVSKTFDSARMRAGLGKKFGELSYIVLGCVACYALGVPLYIAIAISLYIDFMEVMSIMENGDKLGAPIPKFIKVVVNNINDSLRDDDLDTIIKKAEELKK